MVDRIKCVLIVFVIITAVYLLPVSRVLADETEGTYSEDIPYLEGIEVELQRNDGSIGWGWLTGQVERQRSISSLYFEFNRLSAVDYTDYEVVFDFTLKSQLEDGSITTHPYMYVTEITDENSPGFIDNLLISLTIKDDYLSQVFTWQGLIANSPDYQQKIEGGLASGRGLNSYNTVVSQVDCYLREKSTGNHGLVSRFNFTWDSDFWNQNCNAISYKLIVPDTGEELNSQSVENSLFAGSLGADGVDWLEDIRSRLSMISSFLVSLPEILYVIVTNIFTVAEKFSELLKVIFPFIPGLFFDVFAGLIIFSFLVALWKLVKFIFKNGE